MDWADQDKQKLVRAISALETEDEIQRFLRDLMTKKEIEELTRRLKTAEMLMEKVPYSVIEKETGLSSTTIARVAKWLNGKEGGYKIIIDRLHHNSIQSRRGLS